MELDTAETLARSLIGIHLDDAWRFSFDRALRRFGQCRWDDRQITLSRHLVVLNDVEAVRDTILHEIAHARAPRNAGHGATWRRIAAELGARTERGFDPRFVNVPPPVYVGRCPSCGREFHAMRRRVLACAPCCRRYVEGRFSPEFELRWERALGTAPIPPEERASEPVQTTWLRERTMMAR